MYLEVGDARLSVMSTLCDGACSTPGCVCRETPFVGLVLRALTSEGLSVVEVSRRTNVRWQTCAWAAWALVHSNLAVYDSVGRVVPV